jgi:hypothetical protein
MDVPSVGMCNLGHMKPIRPPFSKRELPLLTAPGEPPTLSISPSLTLQTPDGNGEKAMR